MATYFKNVLRSNIGTTEVVGISTASNSRATIIGMSLTNLTGGIVLVDVRMEQLNDISAPSPVILESAYFVKNVALPPNQSLRLINGGEKLVLSPSMKVYIKGSEADSLDLVISYVEIV